MPKRNKPLDSGKKGPGTKGDGGKGKHGDRTKGHTYEFVNLLIHEVNCIKTTKEIDKDEIVLAGIKIVGRSEKKQGKSGTAIKAEKGEAIPVGKFKKGDKKKYSQPKVIAQFPLGSKDGSWPRYFMTSLMLIEEDEGNIGEIVNAVVNAIEEEVVQSITAAAGTAAGTAIGSSLAASGTAIGASAGSAVPIIGTAIGAAVGASIGIAFGAIKKSRANDVFPPEKAQYVIHSYPQKKGELRTPKEVVNFKAFNGEYKVIYSWSVK